MKGVKQMKKQKGITLIALVITIIILIILAAITINAVFGENGLILRAQEAAFKTEVGVIKDLVDVKKLEIETASYLNKFGESLSTYLNNLTSQEHTKYIGSNKLVIDGKGKLAYNPDGDFKDDPQKTWLHQIGIYAAEDGEGNSGTNPSSVSFSIRVNEVASDNTGKLQMGLYPSYEDIRDLIPLLKLLMEIWPWVDGDWTIVLNDRYEVDYSNLEEFLTTPPPGMSGYADIEELAIYEIFDLYMNLQPETLGSTIALCPVVFGNATLYLTDPDGVLHVIDSNGPFIGDNYEIMAGDYFSMVLERGDWTFEIDIPSIGSFEFSISNDSPHWDYVPQG